MTDKLNCTNVEFHDNSRQIKGSITFGGLSEFEVESLFDILFNRTNVSVWIRGIEFIPNSIYHVYRHNDCMVNNEN